MTLIIDKETDFIIDGLEGQYNELLEKVVNAALDYVECPYEIELNILLTDNENIHKLNKEFRNIDSATDVLSFPMISYETPADFSGCETEEECFNPETGEFIESMGGQGYSETSAWSRGASWAIYGFAMMYRYTNCEKNLEVSKKVAKFFIESIKEDYVPAWDFRAPNNDIKDSSAGAIAASGLLEIYAHTNDIYYKEEAEKIVTALAEKCMTGEEREAVLDKATAHLPVNENVEVGLIYADYYFTEAVYKLAMDEYSLPWE